jgi:hypothetical protein
VWNTLTVERASSFSVMIKGEGADVIPKTKENFVRSDIFPALVTKLLCSAPRCSVGVRSLVDQLPMSFLPSCDICARRARLIAAISSIVTVRHAPLAPKSGVVLGLGDLFPTAADSHSTLCCPCRAVLAYNWSTVDCNLNRWRRLCNGIQVVVGVEMVFEKFGVEVPPLAYFCDNGIPFGSGLGSSSAAIVSGLLAGLVLIGKELPVIGQETLLQMVGGVARFPVWFSREGLRNMPSGNCVACRVHIVALRRSQCCI